VAAAAILAQMDLFAVLTPEEVARLDARLRRRRYAKGSVLFLQGDPGNALYVIESGHVKMVVTSPDGKELIIAMRGPGEFFGDMALLDGEPRSADAVAADDCQVLILQRDDFARFIETHPQTAMRLVAELSRRIRRMMRQQQEATLLDVSARIASELLHLAEDRGRPVPDGSGAVTVDLSLTQAELATVIGVTRESVNKWLRYFQRRGWIRWEKGHLTILRPDELRQRIA